ncbi:hypothetical protein [Caulobacter sp.]|uniref:hypothetical protein n=1 Tax=Caulobacter sp. TaxID=78 RepID=UPI0031D9624B
MKFIFPFVRVSFGRSLPVIWGFDAYRPRKVGSERRVRFDFDLGKTYAYTWIGLKTVEVDLKLARRAHALVGLISFPLLILLAAPLFALMCIAKGVDKFIEFAGDAIFGPLGTILLPDAAWGPSFRVTFRRLWKLLVAR